MPDLHRLTPTVGSSAAAGILGATLVLVALALRSILGGPGPDGAIEAYVSWLGDPGRTLRLDLAWGLVTIGGSIMLWAFAALRPHLQGTAEPSPAGTLWSGAGVGFVVLLLAGFSTAEAVPAASYFGAFSVDAATAQSVLLLEGVTFAVTVQASILGAVAVIAGSTLVANTGTFSRWVAWLGYALAAFGIAGFSVESAAAAAAPVWLIVVCALEVRRALPDIHRSTPSVASSGMGASSAKHMGGTGCSVRVSLPMRR